MTIYGFNEIADAERDGFTLSCPAGASSPPRPRRRASGSTWSMSPGNLVPNYYYRPIRRIHTPASKHRWWYPHGGAAGPKRKFLRTLEVQCAQPPPHPCKCACWTTWALPFIDEPVTDEQFLTNATPVPRYPDGRGADHARGGGWPHRRGTFFVRYTNQDGVSGRQTPQHIMGTQIVNGTIITSGGAVANSRAPYMALAQEGATAAAHD